MTAEVLEFPRYGKRGARYRAMLMKMVDLFLVEYGDCTNFNEMVVLTCLDVIDGARRAHEIEK